MDWAKVIVSIRPRLADARHGSVTTLSVFGVTGRRRDAAIHDGSKARMHEVASALLEVLGRLVIGLWR